ncbi:hypothetical protein F5Y11DRAFT_340822 [Daldinia sp. FL1419]|nr:hypothetical protein F5Y11DRAFT_340822 [Daldinia sp. FL1419]
MPCHCKRLTIRYACRHKEQEFFRCWRYNFVKNYFCVGSMVPECDPVRSTEYVHKVCHDCLDYFSEEFGRTAAYSVSQKFLEYKYNNGMHNQAINPRTIPRDKYTVSQAALQRLTERVREDEIARSAENPTMARRKLELFQVPSPREISRVLNDSPAMTPQLSRPVRRSRHQIIHEERCRAHRMDEHVVPLRRMPVYYRSAPINNTSPYSSPSSSCPMIPETTVGSPVREHGTGTPIDLSDLVDDDFDDPPAARGKPPSGPPIQPRPIRPRAKTGPLPSKRSDCSLVQRMTEKAEEIEMRGYQQEDVIRVPAIKGAPKIPTWRTDSPNSAGGIDVLGQPMKTVSYVESKHVERIPKIRTAPAKFVRVKSSADSPMLKTASPVGGVSIPRPRVSGVRLPNSMTFYHERGIPSDNYMEKDSQTGDDDDTPSSLISVSTPPLAFSCGIQPCLYPSNGSNCNECFSCRERQRTERKWRVGWI